MALWPFQILSSREFEYLASRVGFFQGIMQWIVAISLELFISGANLGKAIRAGKAEAAALTETVKGEEEAEARRRADLSAMECRKQLFYAASGATASLALWMLAFYNWRKAIHPSIHPSISFEPASLTGS